MVNLILERKVVTELIENDLKEKNIAAEVRRLLDPDTRTNMLAAYDELEQKLGGTGASLRVAQLMIDDLKNQSLNK